MKFVYLSNFRLPTEKAHGLQIMQMCEAFAKAKNNDRLQIEVELVVPQRKNNLIEDPFLYYDIKPVFKITKLNCWDWPWLGQGQVWYTVQMMSFLVRAKLYLSQKQFDVLYTRTPATSLFFKSIIVEIHDWPSWLVCRSFVFKRVRQFVVLTSFLKQALVKIGIPAERIIVAPDGVRLDQFRGGGDRLMARQLLNLPTDKMIIMYVGSFQRYSWKGLEMLLEASLKLSLDNLVVCVGGLPKEIIDLQNRYRSALFIERQPHSKIPQYLAAADILVLPNQAGDLTSEYYTSPLKLFEYMSSDRPIIASDLPSLREILNEKNSLLIKSDQTDDLVAGISFLLNNQTQAHQLASQARADVEKYSWDIRAKNIIEFIK